MHTGDVFLCLDVTRSRDATLSRHQSSGLVPSPTAGNEVVSRAIRFLCLAARAVGKAYFYPTRAPPNVIKIRMARETRNEVPHDYAQRYSAVLLLVDVDP